MMIKNFIVFADLIIRLFCGLIILFILTYICEIFVYKQPCYQDDIAAADDDILILEDDDNHNQEMGIEYINGETEFEEERMDIKDENIDIHHTPIIDHVDSILSI